MRPFISSLGSATTETVRSVVEALCAYRDELEESREDWGEVSCVRLTLDRTGPRGGKVLSTLWLREDGGTPLRGEIAVDGETVLTADFTSFTFYDTIQDQE